MKAIQWHVLKITKIMFESHTGFIILPCMQLLPDEGLVHDFCLSTENSCKISTWMTGVKLHYHCKVGSWMIGKTMLSWKKDGQQKSKLVHFAFRFSAYTDTGFMLTGILLAEISTYQGGKNLHLVRSTSCYFVWFSNKEQQKTSSGRCYVCVPLKWQIIV